MPGRAGIRTISVMDIHDLRRIGARLLDAVPALFRARGKAIASGVGAAGDKTYPIDSFAEKIVIEGLKELGEPITVVSEERGILEIRGGGRRVLIDPIDGSRNAVAGIPFFCTSIAVADGDSLGDVSLAYVVNLVNRDEFWAERGGGAFLNGERLISHADDILSLVSYEAPSPSRDIPAIMPLLAASRKARCLGATALDLAYLAAGAISVFVTPSPSRSFDFSAGWLLVREAGGIVTNTRGEEIADVPLGLKRISPILAAGNAALHSKALALLAAGSRG